MKLFSKTKDLFGGGKPGRKLFDRVKERNLDYIKRVDADVLLKERDEDDGNTVLLIATIYGYLDVCIQILKKCPSLLYEQNNHGDTVLHRATKNFSLLEFFVSVGLDAAGSTSVEENMIIFTRWINLQNTKGDTALLQAVYYGNIHVVKRLVEVDRQHKLGLSKVVAFDNKTALQWAVENEELEMVKLLTDDEDGDPYSNYIPLSIVKKLFGRVSTGDSNYIKNIDLHVLLNSRDECKLSVLSIANNNLYQLDCCREILKRCPSLLYHQDNKKNSVLHHAVDSSFRPSHSLRYELIEFYVSVGLDSAKTEGENMRHFQKWINLQNSVGNTALIIAAFTRTLDVVKLFVQIDHQYKLGLLEIVGSGKMTALGWAMHYNDPEMIKMLTANLDDYGASTTHNNIPISIGRAKYWTHHSNAMPMMDKFDVGVCDSITTSLSKLASEKFDDELCDFITTSLSKLASDKPQPYSRAQLKIFTKDFSHPLGSGGFGDVYKGQIPDGVYIAVKVLKNIDGEQKILEEQFVAEVDTMGRAYHRNLIKLYGYCYEPNTKFKALVYDYMEKGSLDTFLSDEKRHDTPWEKLNNIAKEIAQGISYLHESCKPQIIHQDIKPANVLLDSNLSPRIIDFGLAKVNMGESQFEQSKIKGSRDYMAPEVNQPEKIKLSCKCDVYSFGKMLFDILGSKRINYHVDKRVFPGQVWEKFKTGELDKFIMDCGIKEEDKENAKRLAIVALLCVEHNPVARPMLSSVVKMLEGKMKLDTPVTPFYPNYYSSESSSSMNDSRDDY